MIDALIMEFRPNISIGGIDVLVRDHIHVHDSLIMI